MNKKPVLDVIKDRRMELINDYCYWQDKAFSEDVLEEIQKEVEFLEDLIKELEPR